MKDTINIKVNEDSIIRTNNVCRDFNTGKIIVHALKDVSIPVVSNTLTILKGRSGSGKTTLMNLLGALDRPSSGEVYFRDTLINKLNERQRDELRRRKFGFVFQSIALISLMSAYENVEFALRIAEYDKNKRKNRAEECLDFVGLGKRMKHRPSEMSGGEQQRVAIARAVSHNPDIIFADEPTAELDTNSSLQVVKLFRNLVEKEGVTVLMTTHDPSMMEVADKVLTLEDGEIVNE